MSALEPPAVAESWWRRRIVGPIVQQLRQGTTPRLIAITLAAGVVFGLFPIFGATTMLCGVVGVAFRLNQPLIQTVNYLLSPVHVLMLLPFYRAGETLFGQEHVPIASLAALTERFWASPPQFAIDYGMVALYGITVWLLVSPLLFVLVYALVRRPVLVLASVRRSHP
ncbi:MAG TPA: DUF2062 domain-containing protein [Nevskiaceae bacterium]|nr:DUF2062 domain-containing protein [Nevskiaceae bacterium]